MKQELKQLDRLLGNVFKSIIHHNKIANGVNYMLTIAFAYLLDPTPENIEEALTQRIKKVVKDAYTAPINDTFANALDILDWIYENPQIAVNDASIVSRIKAWQERMESIPLYSSNEMDKLNKMLRDEE